MNFIACVRSPRTLGQKVRSTLLLYRKLSGCNERVPMYWTRGTRGPGPSLPPHPASIFVLRLHPSTVVKHVIPDTHWDSETRFFVPSNGFRAGVFAIFVKIQLPGVAVPHPVILALNQFDYSAHLFDGALVGPGFSDWFLQNAASPTIPLWSAFRSRIDSNKQNAKERPPDTIFIEQSNKCFNVKANVSCPWHYNCRDKDKNLLAIWAQLGFPDDYGPVVISLLINELSPSRDERL
ncbi:hypothetical protein V8F06_012813 [Rhypophila decipiens]